MIINFNKNYKLLSLFNLTNIEKYLQEIVDLSFEYTSNFIFSYNLDDFKNSPLYKYKFDNSEYKILNKFVYLLNTYIEKDYFFNCLYLYLNCKFKIKFNQFIQILGLRGDSNLKNFKYNILSNLNYGLTFKDFILSSFKARESIIDSSVNIYSSGYLTRKLVESLRNISIKELKCNTKYTIINTYNNELFNIPFLCLSNKSICSFCLNIFYNYNIFMGYNKGVISGQALGEPSTQMLLRTFHLGAGNISQSILNSMSIKLCGMNKNNRYNSNIHNIGTIKNNNYNINVQNNNCNYYNKLNYYNNLNKFMSNNNVEFVVLLTNFRQLWNLILFKKIFLNSRENNLYSKHNIKKIVYYKY